MLEESYVDVRAIAIQWYFKTERIVCDPTHQNQEQVGIAKAGYSASKCANGYFWMERSIFRCW